MTDDLKAAGWKARRWVSDPEAFHLTGPGGVACDVLPDESTEKDDLLRALGNFLIEQN
jgi:hypothetical protein